jgi:S-adenosylmethionine-dependent methyltransferase
MTTPASVFDRQIEHWRREQELPWYRIKHHQVQANLARHLDGRELSVLDAGGGNGLDSLPLAAVGHSVLIVDYSQAMLADAQARADAGGLQGRIQLQQADLADVGDRLAGETFDMVLCHNVIQYLEEPADLLRQLAGLLRPGGLLSLISMNRYSAVYAAAFLRDDLAAALGEIDTRTVRGTMFEALLTIYSAQEAGALLEDAGFAIVADYGLLCITPYWGDTARKHDPVVYAQLVALESALTDKEPYKRLARHYHVIAQKASPAAPTRSLSTKVALI